MIKFFLTKIKQQLYAVMIGVFIGALTSPLFTLVTSKNTLKSPAVHLYTIEDVNARSNKRCIKKCGKFVPSHYLVYNRICYCFKTGSWNPSEYDQIRFIKKEHNME